ncbi:MAG TPA: ABC transporter transmembrane domain-containing protein, partial [Patescibacteria group bacterium]|nr:ABC transporter transmembrane domain-containing protein [Patescibacteria group bacterium]
MKSATAQPKLVRKTMGLYARAIWQYPWLTSGSFFVSTLYTMGEDILLPLLLAHLVDLLIKGNQLHAAYVTLAWFSVVAMSDFVTARLSFTFRNPTLTRTTKDLSMQLFDAYERQEYDFYTNSFVGSLVARANRFTNTFKDLYDAVLFPGTALVLQVAAPIVILSLRSLWLGIAFLVATIAMTAITVVLGRYKTPHLRRSSAAESEVTGALADVLSNNLAVRVFAHTPYERARFDGVVDKRRRLFDKQTQVSERIRAARSMTVVLFQISVAFLLVKLTQSHTISIGTILLAQIYLTKLVSSLWNMNR